jgi:DNA-binding HxlR family transcriptional regulator
MGPSRAIIGLGLTASGVSESGNRARAGTLTLLMVASTTKRHILRELVDGPKPMTEMREEDGSPAEIDLGDSEHTAVKITATGREMLFVSFVLERWLLSSPHGPLEFGSDSANDAIAALACAWSSTVMHALALQPLALPELHRAIDTLSYRSLEDHVDAMEQVGQVVARVDSDGKTRYEVTDWLRQAIAPLAAAARLERISLAEDTAPIADIDVGASFLLTLPLLELPRELSGSCRLAVQLPSDESQSAGVTAEVAEGRVGSYRLELDSSADAWASGSADEWLDTVIEPGAMRVDAGGDERLTHTLLEGLHETLFGIPVR